MKQSDLIASAMNVPWAITPDGLEQLIAIARREGDVGAVAMRQEQRLPMASRAGVRNGIATINLIGPVLRYGNIYTDISGATSLQVFANDLQIAIDSPNVKAVLLNIDSPGGMAAGIAETAAAIRAARKPVWAFIDDLGASAAYWLASGASRIVASRTANVGSIGVVATLRKSSDPDQVEIVSSRAPKKRLGAGSDEGKAAIQQIVDNLESVFVADIAKHRGKSADHVTKKFGEGGIVFAPAAAAVGMVDAVGSYESTIEQLGSRIRNSDTALTNHAALEAEHTRVKWINDNFNASDVPALIATGKCEGTIAGEAIKGTGFFSDSERRERQSQGRPQVSPSWDETIRRQAYQNRM